MEPDFTAEIPGKKISKESNPIRRKDQLKDYIDELKYSKSEVQTKLLIAGITLLGAYAIVSILFSSGKKEKRKHTKETSDLPAVTEPENQLLGIFKSILISLALAYAKKLLISYIESLSHANEEN